MGLTQKLGLLAQSVFQDSSLNVGIGAAPSGTYKFEVTGTAKVSGITSLTSATASTSTSTGALVVTGGVGIGGALFGTSAVFNHNDAPTIKVQRSGGTDTNTALEFTNASRSFFIGSNGTVMGLGGTSGSIASQPLQITSTGAATFSSSVSIPSSTGLILGQTSVTDGIISSVSSTVGLNFKIGTTSALYINGSATPNVGIGTVSPSEKLHLYDSNYPVIRMSAGAATTDSYYLYANQSARFYITNVSSGNGAYLVYNSSSGWTGVSDARWKTDWTDLDGSLSLINRLNIGKYKMLNNDKEVIENARWDYGIKAQELLDIIPDAVDVPKDENDKYGVIHNIVFYNAVKAIQELSAQVQEQNQTIQNLQEQNQDLKSRLDKAGL